MNVRICQGPRVDGFSHVTILVFAASQKGEKSKSRNSRDYTFRSFWDLGHAQRLHFCISFTSWMPHCPSPGFFSPSIHPAWRSVAAPRAQHGPDIVALHFVPHGWQLGKIWRSTWLEQYVQRNCLFVGDTAKKLGTWCWKCLPSGQLT